MTTKLIENCTCGRCAATQDGGAAPSVLPSGHAPVVGESWQNAAGDTVTVTATGLMVTPRAPRDGEAPPVRVTGITEGANALRERTARMLANARPAEQVDPFAGRAVVGLCLTPRAPDGSGGVVVKVIRTGEQPQREYAEPKPYFATSEAAPASTDELAHLKDEAKRLQAILDDPATGAIDRQRAGYRLTAITTRIEQLEVALHPVPQAGKAPTAGARQFAQPTPHFQLSDAQRAEHEAQATALRAKLAAPGLSPGQRIRLEQELQHLEDLLRMDASPTPDQRPFEERRVQG